MAAEQFAVEGLLEELLHHGWGPLKVFDGFKQGHHQQGGLMGHGIHQSRLLGEQQHLQQVRHRVTHRDHVGAADALAEFLLQPLQHPEHVKGLLGGFSPWGADGDQRPSGLQLLQQPGHPGGFVHLAVGHGQLEIAAEFVEGIAMAGALLAYVEAGQAEGKNLGLADQVLQRLAAQARALQAVLNQFEVVAELINGAVVKFLAIGSLAVPGRFPAGIGQLLIALVGKAQPFQGVAEFQPVGLEAEPGGLGFVNLGEAQSVHLE